MLIGKCFDAPPEVPVGDKLSMTEGNPYGTNGNENRGEDAAPTNSSLRESLSLLQRHR